MKYSEKKGGGAISGYTQERSASINFVNLSCFAIITNRIKIIENLWENLSSNLLSAGKPVKGRKSLITMKHYFAPYTEMFALDVFFNLFSFCFSILRDFFRIFYGFAEHNFMVKYVHYNFKILFYCAGK